jgi:radical SAM superfamily enzyme YgiQ (UPF0313 family)
MKKKNILLVNPPVYDFAAFDLWSKPLGILYLSSILKQNGFCVEMVDYMDRHFNGAESKSDEYGCGHYNKLRVQKPEVYKNIPRYYSRYGSSRETAENYFKQQACFPDIILVTSVMTYWYPGVWETIESLKAIFPKTPVILGGTYATLCPEHAKNSGADYVVEGGFHCLNDILKKLNIQVNMPDFSSFPAPDFSYYSKSRYAVLRMSMGCPFRCSYCAQDVLCGGKYDIKPPEKVFEEIKTFAGNGINNIVFYDDALLYDPDRNIKPLLRKIIEEKLTINIHTPNGLHARYLDIELAQLMKKAGFIMPRFSLETSDTNMQKETGAKVSNDSYITAMQTLQKAGYKSGEYLTYILIGMPNQSLKDVENSIKFASRLGSKVSLSEYSVIPRTKDFLKIDKKFTKEPLYHNKSVYPLFNLNEWKDILSVKAFATQQNKIMSNE